VSGSSCGYGLRVRGGTKAWTAVWLLLLVAIQAAGFYLVWRYSLHTVTGQWLDTAALAGNQIGQEQIQEPVSRILNAVSVLSLLAATLVIGFIALIRGRVALAITAILLIGGANVTTQLLKFFLIRPDFGIDPERSGAGNSLPSGHAAVAASVAVALVLVLPRKGRALAALLGAGYAAAAGVATLSAGWHRPSDAVAAFLVVGIWAGIAGLLLLFTQRAQAQVEPAEAHRVSLVILGVGGLLLCLATGAALAWLAGQTAIPPDELRARTLFIAYAGSAAGITGAMALVMTSVLVTLHRLVPSQKG